MRSPAVIRHSLLLVLAIGAAACDFEIPSLPGGGGGTGGGGVGGGTCELVGCPDCEAPLVCDPVLGCVQCIDSGDCSEETPVCTGNRCVECTVAEADACQAGQVCSRNRCDQACDVDADCSNMGEFCPGQQCRFSRCVCCEENTDCVQDDDSVCDTNAGICRQCLDDADCSAIDEGSLPKCRADGVCVGCLVAEDCPQPGICQANNSCAPRCCETKDCVVDSASPICDTATGECTACTGPGQCLVGTCDLGRCVECQGDSSCTNPALPACVNNICVECSDTQMCPSPNICFESVCFAPT